MISRKSKTESCATSTDQNTKHHHLSAENDSVQHNHKTRNSEEKEGNKIAGRPFPDGLGVDAQTLGPAEGVHLREQIELDAFPLQLGDALGQQLRVLLLPVQQLLQMRFDVALVPDRPYEPQRAQQRAERWDPGLLAQVGPAPFRGAEQEEERRRVEEEEEAVEVGDLFARRVDLGFFQREAVQNQLFLFQPLLQEELVARVTRDLLEGMHRLRFHQ